MFDDNKKSSNVGTRFAIRLFIILFVLVSGFYVLYSLMGIPRKVTFNQVIGPINNPLMGWAPWSTADNIQQPHSLIYADLTWREFEPQEGHFDFISFEEHNQLAMWKEKGVRVVFRFVMDFPRASEHLDIPDWLYEKTGGNGDHYSNDYGKGYSPDYSDPILIDAHAKAIQALGNRYSQDDYFAYIELGSLGHWGEWHVNTDSGIRPLPDEAIRDQYVNHYLTAFPQTHLLMRRPFSIAKEEALGLYNDMMGHPDATKTWLDWIENGGEFSQTGEKDALAAMPDGWQVAPIGGEQTVYLSDEELFKDSLTQTLDLLRASHTTFIGPGGPYDVLPGSALQAGLDQVLVNIGYRFFVSELKMPERAFLGRSVKRTVTIENIGNAPMYYPWPLWFYLIDDAGDIQAIYSKYESMMGVLPGQSRSFEFSLPVGHLENGVYSVGVGIVDPLTDQPAVRFAMDNPRNDRIQILRDLEVALFFNYFSLIFRGK